MEKFDLLRVRIARSGCFLFHGLHLPTGKGHSRQVKVLSISFKASFPFFFSRYKILGANSLS